MTEVTLTHPPLLDSNKPTLPSRRTGKLKYKFCIFFYQTCVAVGSGVRQGCRIAPDLFLVLMDHMMERNAHRGMAGVTLSSSSIIVQCGRRISSISNPWWRYNIYSWTLITKIILNQRHNYFDLRNEVLTDLDFADDVALLVEMVKVLVLAMTAICAGSRAICPPQAFDMWALRKILRSQDTIHSPYDECGSQSNHRMLCSFPSGHWQTIAALRSYRPQLDHKRITTVLSLRWSRGCPPVGSDH